MISMPTAGIVYQESKVVGLCTDHRLSLAEQSVLLVRPIATSFATYDRYVPILRQRRQVAGREEVSVGNAKRRAQFGRTFRIARLLPQQMAAPVGLEIAQWSHDRILYQKFHAPPPIGVSTPHDG